MSPEQRADADCRQGFANLQVQVDKAEEWEQVWHQGWPRPTWTPKRAMMIGMRDHLAASMVLNG